MKTQKLLLSLIFIFGGVLQVAGIDSVITIRIEGEEFTRMDGTFTTLDGTDLSGGKAVAISLKLIENGQRFSPPFYTNYFELESAEWNIEKFVSQEAPLNVFEEKNAVVFDVNCFFPDDKTHDLHFTVTDFWEKEAKRGELVIQAGKKSVVLNIGNFQKGWYKITVMDSEGTIMYTTTFSVVPNMNERYNGENPFGYDVVMSWYIHKSKWSDYTKAIKLAGVKWVRERYTFYDTYRQNGAFDFSRYDGAYTALHDAGLNISTTWHDSPAFLKQPYGQLPSNLFDAYNLVFNVAHHFGEKVKAWEIWNEQDAQVFLTDPPDTYASYLKATAIALSDVDSKPIKTNGGWTRAYSKTSFVPIALQNEIMNYVDIFNAHRHRSIEDKLVLELPPTLELDTWHYNVQYNRDRRPFWMTESGMYLRGIYPDDVQLATQARYLVTSTLESLSKGAQRHFWFIFINLADGKRQMGSLTEDETPYPCYQAQAIMTNILGKGEYLGIVNDLPTGTYGYVFESGIKGDVAVLWSDVLRRVTFKTKTPVTVVDIMGKEMIRYPTDSKVEIEVSYNPQYVVFEGKMDKDNYTRYYNYTFGFELPSKTFSQEERIVLCQKFEAEAYNNPKYEGYKLARNTPNNVEIEIYNFNNKKIEGTIKCLLPAHWKAEDLEKPVSVMPMSKSVVSFNISANDDVAVAIPYELGFIGKFDGKYTTRSVSLIAVREKISIPPVRIWENAKKPENWIRTISSNGTWSNRAWPEEKAVIFSNSFSSGDRWTYPEFYIDDTDGLEGSSGLCFEAWTEEEIPGRAGFVIIESSGRRFFSPIGFVLQPGWNRYYVPWSGISNLDNNNDMNPLEIEKIKRVSVGCNISANIVPDFAVRNIGPYVIKVSKNEVKEIIINDLSDGQIITDGILKFTFTLPEGSVREMTRIVLGRLDIDYSVSTDVVSVNKKDIEDGIYQLTVVGYNRSGKSTTKRLILTFRNKL